MSTVEVLEPEIVRTPEGDEAFYEVVDDQRVEQLPVATNAIRFAFNIASEIQQYCKGRDLGQAITENLFRLRSKPSLQRRPDAAFVSYDRWPKQKRVTEENAWDVIPDLIVEVVSPTNYAEEIPTRIREYFEAGVRRAWVVYLHESLVYEYDAPRSIRVLGIEDTLDGGTVIPGFQLPLAELFDQPEESDPT
jgi:Uma2 family endonuclease